MKSAKMVVAMIISMLPDYFQNIVMFKLLCHLTVISCGAPPPPPLRGEYDYMGGLVDTVTYKCHHKYDLEGNRTLTCNSTGEWEAPPCCKSECYHIMWVVHPTGHTL